MSFENTVGKAEITHNKQFLLFPQYFLPGLSVYTDTGKNGPGKMDLWTVIVK